MTNATQSTLASEQRVAIADLADDLGCYKQTIFKIVKRLSIAPQDRRESSRGNQKIKTVDAAEAELIKSELRRSTRAESLDGLPAPFIDERGVFYVIQLEPEHDPRRVKVGFGDLDERFRDHRCSVPFARVVKSWPCRRTWERAVTDCITEGYEQLGKEVFCTTSLEDILARAERFFALMPVLSDRDGLNTIDDLSLRRSTNKPAQGNALA